jgi:hypothetical protein
MSKSTNSAKNVQFKSEEEDSEWDSDLELTGASNSKSNEGQQDYYDPIYFDSDTESESDREFENGHDMQYKSPPDVTTSSNNSVSITSIKDLTNHFEKSTLSSSKKSTKNVKKHATVSNDDLFYDPDQDDKDQEWLFKKIAGILQL